VHTLPARDVRAQPHVPGVLRRNIFECSTGYDVHAMSSPNLFAARGQFMQKLSRGGISGQQFYVHIVRSGHLFRRRGHCLRGVLNRHIFLAELLHLLVLPTRGLQQLGCQLIM